jgi:hypothetical protein
MVGSLLQLAAASCAVTTEAPQWRQAGRAGSEQANGLQRCRNSDALFVPKCQSVLDNLIADFHADLT